MKSFKFILPVVAFVIAIVGAFTSIASSNNSSVVNYYGVTGGSCTLGTLEGTCNASGSTRCTVSTSSASGIPAFTGINVNLNPDACTAEVFKSN